MKIKTSWWLPLNEFPSFGSSPNYKTAKTEKAAHIEAIASQPWSKSWPKGDAAPVLRAYFPSIASKVWYMKAAMADMKW